jgi:prophage regulatory protein
VDRKALPETGFVRIKEIVAPNGVFPISRSAWYAGIAEGRYPKGYKLSSRSVGWRVEEIRALIESMSNREL